jgi:hypothetical protein
MERAIDEPRRGSARNDVLREAMALIPMPMPCERLP